MAKYWESVKREFKRYKKGFMVGGAAGLVAAFYAKAQGIDITFAARSTGLMDRMISMPAMELAYVKVLITLMVLGALAGYLINKFLVK